MMPWVPENYLNANNLCYPQPCIPQETVISNVKLARAYVPYQRICTLYPPEEALHAGTAFPELYQPYVIKKTLKPKIMPLREECNHESK
ncbi:MAG: spore coat associated protein CotJA [Firmicutes bacterium]|nr:spore coat associated protein CotJA [Bacillota bacterium]